MPEITESLEPPLLLIAMPQVVDPFFHRSVILLLEHARDGSFGLIVNRPTDVPVGEILSELEVSWGGDPEAPSWFGGPVQPNVGTVLYRGDDPIGIDTAVEVAPGIRVSRDVRVLLGLIEHPPVQFRLILGYAGWGGGQLEQEIERNDWLIAPVDPGRLFTSHPAEMWEQTLGSIGVRPESLPSWTIPGDGETSN